MVFNSVFFLVFALLFFPCYHYARKSNTGRWICIILFSLLFYGWTDIRLVVILLITSCIDYLCGIWIDRFHGRRKFFLLISIISNTGFLLVFKYSTFFLENINLILKELGSGYSFPTQIPGLSTFLTIGLSFHALQSLTYTIDVYRKKIRPIRNILHFLAFESMFPLLLAGPITRARDLLPQLERTRNISEQERWDGLKLIVFGLFKKAVIADNLAPLVNFAFTVNQSEPSGIYWWLIITSFAFQLYFDFSGYSDIARGLMKWMGLFIRVNFRNPYISKSITEFWQRWHISLSRWLREYLFLPVAFAISRKMPAYEYLGIRTDKIIYVVAVFTTFLIGGFWHGASWNFIIWGALFGFYLSVEKITKYPKRLAKRKYLKMLNIPVTLLLVWISWIFFKSSTLDQGISILFKMFSFYPGLDFISMNKEDLFLGSVALILGILIEYLVLKKKYIFHFYQDQKKRLLDIVTISVLVVSLIYFRGEQVGFIYFQF